MLSARAPARQTGGQDGPRPRDNQRVSARRRRKERHGLLEAYRAVRKPMPPPERVIPDEREKLREREAEEEILDAEREVGEGETGR